MTALTDAVKDEIQTAYRTWLAARDFKPRRGQRQMCIRDRYLIDVDMEHFAPMEISVMPKKKG